MSYDDLPQDAYAVRPRRIVGDEMRLYEAITWPSDQRGTIIMYLHRLLDRVQDDGSGCGIDILNESGDIVAEFKVTRAGFEYLRDRWHFRRVIERYTGDRETLEDQP